MQWLSSFLTLFFFTFRRRRAEATRVANSSSRCKVFFKISCIHTRARRWAATDTRAPAPNNHRHLFARNSNLKCKLSFESYLGLGFGAWNFFFLVNLAWWSHLRWCSLQFHLQTSPSLGSCARTSLFLFPFTNHDGASPKGYSMEFPMSKHVISSTLTNDVIISWSQNKTKAMTHSERLVTLILSNICLCEWFLISVAWV